VAGVAGRERVAAAGRSAAGPLRATPAQGDTLDLNVPGTSCTDGTPVRAVARRVGQSAVFLEDIENPVVPAFTQAQYDSLDAQLTTVTLPVLTDYFGAFEDVDDNDRVLVLITKEVNERENLGGFVFSGDLVSTLSCAESNEAEIFYGVTPDTAGVHGTVRTRESLRLVYPSLIAHELTHILQFTTFFREGVSVKSRWELEGGATLAEQLVGYAALGDGPRQNLGFDDWLRGHDPDWYLDWVVDMALYFGFKGQDDPPAMNAPEQCSWIGTPDQGNTGPCENNRAVYGVPSTLLRFVLDLYGPGYPGGEAALMRQLTNSPFRNLEVLEQVTGEDKVSLLVSFAAMMWADDRPGLGDWLLSWNVFDIFETIGVNNDNARLRPYEPDRRHTGARRGSPGGLERLPPLDSAGPPRSDQPAHPHPRRAALARSHGALGAEDPMTRTPLVRNLAAGTAVILATACASSGANDTASNGPDEAVVSGAPCLAGTVFTEGADIAPRTWLHPSDGERVELVGTQVENVRLLTGTTVEVCGPAREPGAPIEVVEVTLVQVDGMPAALGSLRSAGSGWVLEPLAGGECARAHRRASRSDPCRGAGGVDRRTRRTRGVSPSGRTPCWGGGADRRSAGGRGSRRPTHAGQRAPARVAHRARELRGSVARPRRHGRHRKHGNGPGARRHRARRHHLQLRVLELRLPPDGHHRVHGPGVRGG
jgi:hypothetical protein